MGALLGLPASESASCLIGRSATGLGLSSGSGASVGSSFILTTTPILSGLGGPGLFGTMISNQSSHSLKPCGEGGVISFMHLRTSSSGIVVAASKLG